MSLFDDYLAQLRNPGDVEPPETILDDLANAHQEALSDATAAVQQRDRLLKAEREKAAALQADLNAAKARNFDNLINVAAGDNGATVDTTVQRGKQPRSYDALFKRK
jgi:hypothetical protein